MDIDDPIRRFVSSLPLPLSIVISGGLFFEIVRAIVRYVRL